MKLDRVTITGADNSVSPAQLIDLSARYPFVEWGILYSATQEGGLRFPSRAWRERLQYDCRGLPVRLSLHLCGRRMRDLLVGKNTLPVGLTEGFDHIQLNFHAEVQVSEWPAFHDVLHTLGDRQIIFQIDGNMGVELYDDVHNSTSVDAVPLFDVSHGAGVLPEGWPAPLDGDYHGYAGGLGPDNLAEQIPAIGRAAGDARIWIDMETRVRSHGDQQFDLEKVERCLQIATPFVTP